MKTALEADLIPIVCVGEVLEEREAGLTEDVLRRQCLRAFHAISGKKAGKLVVAYEPVWAIGTGKTATPQLAAEAHVLIRGEAATAFGGMGSQTAFGPRGAASALSKATTWSAIIFMVTSITLSIAASRRGGPGSVLQGLKPSQTKSQPSTPVPQPAPPPAQK